MYQVTVAYTILVNKRWVLKRKKTCDIRSTSKWIKLLKWSISFEAPILL